jgi:hypothetical protein
MPALGTDNEVVISYDGTETGVTAGDTTTYTLLSDNVLDGVVWPDEGIYVYSIKETNSVVDWSTDDLVEEILHNSLAEYTLKAFVNEDPANPGTYVLWAVTVVREADDNGEDADGEKVEPTTEGEETEEVTFSEMTFLNTYAKFVNIEDIGDVEDAYAAGTAPLTVSKTVTGDVDADKYFEFELAVTMPSFVETNPNDAFDALQGPYTAYLFNAAGELLDGTALAGLDYEGDYEASTGAISFASGDATIFYLKHQWQLVFTNLVVGSDYAVEETGEFGYLPSIKVTYDHTVVTIGVFNTNLGVDGQLVADRELGFYSLAAYTNFGSNPNTGLNLNTLPFYGMILLAVAALGTYLAVKASKRKAQQF